MLTAYACLVVFLGEVAALALALLSLLAIILFFFFCFLEIAGALKAAGFTSAFLAAYLGLIDKVATKAAKAVLII